MELFSNEADLFHRLKNEGCDDLEKAIRTSEFVGKKYAKMCSEMECLSGRMTGMCHIVIGLKQEMKVQIEYALGEIRELKKDHEQKIDDMRMRYEQRFSELQLENEHVHSINRQLIDNIDDRLQVMCKDRIVGDGSCLELAEGHSSGKVSLMKVDASSSSQLIETYREELVLMGSDEGHFFNEYAMDGLSSEHDEIYLELMPDNVLRALKTAHNAKSVKVKLTKKQAPALTFEVELPTVSTHARLVIHDVPVHVIPQRHWQEYEEPEVPQFDVSIHLPQLKVLRNIAERMKNVSNYVTVAANHSGEMRLTVETDLVNITTHFRDLDNHNWNDDRNQQQLDEKQFYEARIDIRKFAQFLSGQQVNPQRVICNLVQDRVVHILLLHDDVSLQYFLPVISA